MKMPELLYYNLSCHPRMLDKEATLYDDVFDAFGLALCFYRFSE